VLFASTGLLFAGAELGLDAYNMMLPYYQNGNSFWADASGVWEGLRTYMFAPVGLSFNLFIVKIFDANIHIARLIYLFLGIMSSFFLFLTSRKIGFPVVISLLSPAVAFVGLQFWVWYNIHCQEPIGLFFMTMSFYFISVAKPRNLLFDVLAIFASLCMSLSKETFILVIPALVIFRYYVAYQEKREWIKSIWQCLWYALPVSLLFIGELSYILLVMKGGGRGYAGISSSLGILDYIKHFFLLFANNQIYIYLLFAILFIAVSSQDSLLVNIKQFTARHLPLLLAIKVLLLLQTIVYAKTGWGQSRYLLPSFVAISLFLMLVLHHLSIARSANYKILTYALVFYIFLELAPKLSDNPQQTFRAARNHVSFCEQSEALIQSVVSNSKEGSLILIVSNPEVNTVQPTGMESLLKNLHHRRNIRHLPISPPHERSTNYEQRLAEIPQNFKEITDKAQINNIVIMPFEEELFLDKAKDWFDATQYQRLTFWKMVHYYKK
jgi:hypothetical protein